MTNTNAQSIAVTARQSAEFRGGRPRSSENSKTHCTADTFYKQLMRYQLVDRGSKLDRRALLHVICDYFYKSTCVDRPAARWCRTGFHCYASAEHVLHALVYLTYPRASYRTARSPCYEPLQAITHTCRSHVDSSIQPVQLSTHTCHDQWSTTHGSVLQ